MDIEYYAKMIERGDYIAAYDYIISHADGSQETKDVISNCLNMIAEQYAYQIRESVKSGDMHSAKLMQDEFYSRYGGHSVIDQFILNEVTTDHLVFGSRQFIFFQRHRKKIGIVIIAIFIIAIFLLQLNYHQQSTDYAPATDSVAVVDPEEYQAIDSTADYQTESEGNTYIEEAQPQDNGYIDQNESAIKEEDVDSDIMHIK